MSFFHAPTAVSLAIGTGLTLLDLAVSQHLAARRMFEEFETVRLRAGESLLDALEKAGVVEVRRDGSGQIDRVIGRADQTTILYEAWELLRQDLQSRVPLPLSNTRLELGALRRLR